MPDNEHIAQRVKTLRKRRDWTAQRLADECAKLGAPSLTRSTIAKIESGVRKLVKWHELVTLAHALEVQPADLVEGDLDDSQFDAPHTPSVREEIDSLRAEIRERLDQLAANQEQIIELLSHLTDTSAASDQARRRLRQRTRGVPADPTTIG